mmetsp:Transcript_46518/g.140935  ORF Transcript_46518/g.140935 Transcript_46518/m.140935 type:complete len:468 (-) Transcript_46518:106-1509(-)
MRLRFKDGPKTRELLHKALSGALTFDLSVDERDELCRELLNDCLVITDDEDDDRAAEEGKGASAHASNAKVLTLGDIMGSLLVETSRAASAPRARLVAAAKAIVALEKYVHPDDALALRCCIYTGLTRLPRDQLLALARGGEDVDGGDGIDDIGNEQVNLVEMWVNQVPRTFLPPSLAEDVDKMVEWLQQELFQRRGNDYDRAGPESSWFNASISPPPASVLPFLPLPPPFPPPGALPLPVSMSSHLVEAARLAVSGWSSGKTKKGQHGAVIVAADGNAVLGKGCNVALKSQTQPEAEAGGVTSGTVCECTSTGIEKRAGGVANVQKITGGVKKRKRAGGHRGKHVLHAEMVAIKSMCGLGHSDDGSDETLIGAIAHEGPALDVEHLHGSTVYVARLTAGDAYFEDGRPCERCSAVLQSLGVARAVYTRRSGRPGVMEFSCTSDNDEHSPITALHQLDSDQKEWIGL